MPEFSVKEVRMPELHLPEIKRDEIVRSLSGVRIPEIDLAKARRVKVPTVTLTRADVGKLLAAGATIARFVRPAPSRSSWLAGKLGRRSRPSVTRLVQPRRRRSRWPFAVGGLLVAMVAIWAVLRRPAVRVRVDAVARDARARIDELRGAGPQTAMELHEPVALAATELTETEIDGVPGLNDDTGSTSVGPAFEESETPV